LITIKLPRKLFVVLAAITALTVTGIIVAAWSTSGSGNGYAKAASASALTIGDASASTTADLYPGATGAVKLKVTNPNSFPIRVTAVTKQASSSITSDKGAACTAATGVTFTDQSGLTLDVVAGRTSTFTLTGAVAMTNASDNSDAVGTLPAPSVFAFATLGPDFSRLQPAAAPPGRATAAMARASARRRIMGLSRRR
jgi:hypothetical protein